LGAEHPDTLAAMNNLAATLADQGELDSARQLQEQVLEARRRVVGPQHPDTLAALNNLAYTLQAQGDLVGARQLQEQVVETAQWALGAEHPKTLTAMNNLAYTLLAQGDPVGARQLQEQVRHARHSTQSAASSTLTAAELRLLPLLSTHLTFREIGERLYLSRNTVKTLAMSIYRKLGASSRSQVIARAQNLGLLDR